jgi:hypothetical protein
MTATAPPAPAPPAIADEQVHDLFIIPANQKLYHLAANLDTDRAGYVQAKAVDFADPAFRKAMNIARLQENGQEPARGPALAILPNKPDPSTSQICCFLVNVENARAANPWTAAEWSNEPDGKNEDLKEPVLNSNGVLKVLLAGATGKVFLVELNENLEKVTRCESLDLNLEGEIYVQLRNGAVAGSARSSTEGGAVLPLVNVTSLMAPA